MRITELMISGNGFFLPPCCRDFLKEKSGFLIDTSKCNATIAYVYKENCIWMLGTVPGKAISGLPIMPAGELPSFGLTANYHS